MSERITVPATLPGVLRRGTPVSPTHVGAWHYPTSTDSNPQINSMRADSVVRRPPHPAYDSVYLCDWGNTPIAHCLVDLEDATGRAHVAWAIAAALGECQWAPLVRWEHPDGRAQAWTMQYGANVCRFWYAGTGRGPCHDLDWHDDTRLADGSRRVDALALRAVALHVLGGDS